MKVARHIAKTPEIGTSGGVRDLSGDDLSSNDKVIIRHILRMYSITGLSENCKKYTIILIGHLVIHNNWRGCIFYSIIFISEYYDDISA